MQKVQIVIPIFNEEECAPELISRVQKLSADPDFDFEVIFVDDGSKDRTLQILEAAAKTDERIKIVGLARNFGHQMALTAGLDHCDADYVAIIDGDLQDPPELIPQMLRQLQNNNLDLVYGKRKQRPGETWFKKLTAKMFYELLSRTVQVPIPKDTGDFRVINRKILLAFSELRERHRFIRGLVPWLGFKSEAFEYVRDVRFAGTTKYPLTKMLKFALDAIFSFSNKPLRMATYVGLICMGFGLLGGGVVVYRKIFEGHLVDGWASLIVTVVFFGGVQILMLGVLGEYIGRIFEEVKGRPLYVVNQKMNFQEKVVGLRKTS